MAQLPELTSTADRKRLLLAQCEICRRSLGLQLAALRNDTSWFQRGVDSVARYRAFLWLAAPLAGFLIARRGRLLRGVLIRGVTTWQVLSRLWRWTRAFRRAR